MKLRNYFGFFIIFIVVISMVAYTLLSQSGRLGNLFTSVQENKELAIVEGYLGWEKRGFFEDDEVKRIFRDEYGLDVRILKKGSIEMVREDTEGKDYLFPSNKIATELYNSRTGAESETVFFSPIVVYSWRSIIPDLEAAQYITNRNGVYFLNTQKVIQDIEAGATWQTVGGTSLQGRVSISSTDPSKSSSGNLFSALVLQTMIGSGNTPTESDVTPEVRQRVQNFFSKMGLLESSSGDIFDKFLTLGRTTYPMVVGYESQLIEVIHNNSLNVSDIITLYPEPTVWAEHGFISLSENGEKLEQALLDNERLSQIAWERYGLRKVGRTFDTSLFTQYGIAPEVTNVTPLPRVEVIEKIITPE